MAIDRDQVEQEAMKLLRKGQNDRALERYQALLKHDPRDRRIRQKVAELYLKLGRQPEAERQFREVARQLVASGQDKAAITVFKQLVRIKPDDAELLQQLGQCYMEAGFPNDARTTWQKAVEMLHRVYPDQAVPIVEKLIQLDPADQPLKIRLAEILESAHWSERAFDQWRRLAEDARRMGNADDRVRFLSQALRLRKDALGLILDLAETRLQLGETPEALELLQRAYAEDSTDIRTLGLLATTFSTMDQPAKARPIWEEVAKHHQQSGDVLARAQALEAALACGDADSGLQSEVDGAKRAAERVLMRLHRQPWAQPRGEAEARTFVRAEVFWRYGLEEAALALLEDQASIPLVVLRAELLVATGDVDGGIALIRGVQPPSNDAAGDLAQRLAVLEQRGDEPPSDDADDDPVDDEVVDEVDDDDLLDDDLFDDELLDDELDEIDDLDDATDPGEPIDDEPTYDAPFALPSTDEDEGDRLRRAGDLSGAMAAYRRALTQDPTAETVLMKLGELMSQAPVSAPDPEPSPVDLFQATPAAPDFGDLFDGAPTVPAHGSASVAGHSQARAWLAVGQPERALQLLQPGDDLEAQVLMARARREQAQLPVALSALRLAVADAAEDDPAYTSALLELSRLNAQTGKLRGARRLLDELQDLAPEFEAAQVSELRAGIELLGSV